MSDWIKAGQQELVDPVEGEVTGVFLGVKDDVGPNHSRMYTLKLSDGKQVGMWGATALDNQMVEVVIGEEVKISYKGMKENPKTNRSFKNYEVFHRFPDGVTPTAQTPKANAQTKVGGEAEEGGLPF